MLVPLRTRPLLFIVRTLVGKLEGPLLPIRTCTMIYMHVV